MPTYRSATIWQLIVLLYPPSSLAHHDPLFTYSKLAYKTKHKVPNIFALHNLQKEVVRLVDLVPAQMLVEMSFRSIRPSSGDGSASNKNPGQSTPESSGSDPRRNRDDKDGGEASTSTSKRRRVPESVTRNACLNCKKARAKVSRRLVPTGVGGLLDAVLCAV